MLLSITVRAAYCEQPTGTVIAGTVISVESGDTFTLKTGDRTERIRLEGIDCPEMEQPFGDKAKQFTASKILNKQVEAAVISRDNYNGTWAMVSTSDGRSLNQELLKVGLAWWYHKYSDDQSLGELETKARLKHRGLWNQIAPIAPWDFRRGVWGVTR
jgi:endonuclease YncB( thermonuclease family)